MMFRFIFLLTILIPANMLLAADITLSSAIKDGAGIRPLTMGGAYTAIAEGEFAMMYNPAGLSMPGGQYSYQQLDYGYNIYNEFSGHFFYTTPIGYSSWQIKDKSNNSVAITALGYGRSGRNGVDWGINYKMIKANINGVETDGWSSDLGILVHLYPSMTLGVLAQDFFKKEVDISSTIATGIAFHNRKKTFVLSTDLITRNELNETVYRAKVGSEINIADGLTLRGGYFDESISAGANFVLPFLEVEYGMIDSQKDSELTQYMLGVKLGKGIDAYQSRKRYSLFKDKSYAEFAIGGNLTEGKSEVSLMGGFKVGTNELLALIKKANEDKSCKGYVMRLSPMSGSLASIGMIQEIRNELLKGKENGKEIYSYFEGWATLPDYYLASISDLIMMPELGTISHLGLEMSVKKTRQFLGKFGLKDNIISSGAYKDSLNPHSEDLSGAEIGHLTNLVEGLYDQVMTEIESSRSLDWERVKEVFDGRFITADQALGYGLIDKLGFWDQMDDVLDVDVKTGRIALDEFSDPNQPRTVLSYFERIAVIEVDGTISMGNNSSNILFGGKQTGADDVAQMLEGIAKDFTIKGVIIRVNSPGGSMLASDQIYKAIAKLKRRGKIVYTSMGNLAASGGYYVALNSDKIIANPGTLTGSIGVIRSQLNFDDFNKLMGIEHQSIKTGKYMDIMSSNKSLTDDERSMLQSHQDYFYQLFVDKVIANRHLTPEEAYNVAQGQVMSGEDAVKLKLVDKVGGFYDAVDDLAEELKLDDPEIVYVRRKAKFSMPFINLGVVSKMMAGESGFIKPLWKYLN